MPPRHEERYEAIDTEFEEDLSDYEEYSGRRSEDSVSMPLYLIFNFFYYIFVPFVKLFCANFPKDW
jgi:hypothetical protein